MLTATSKQKKEEEILNIFSEIRETTTKDSIEYKKLVQKSIHLFGIGLLSVSKKKMSGQLVLKFFTV